MTLDTTFAVESTVYSTLFKHTQYPALKVKDAIADQFRKKFNRRPNVNTLDPDLLINVHITENDCTISLNSSGEPLFKRGYRTATQEAPLNEILAAGLIYLSGWNPSQNLFDPMCGSGTILIEAAMISNNLPPGMFRNKYCFMNWKDFDLDLFSEIKSMYKDTAEKKHSARIYGSDISRNAIHIAVENSRKANMQNSIRLSVNDFFNSKAPFDEGIIITNPPYGERLKQEDIVDFYKSIGNTLKNSYKNYNVWILSGNLKAMKYIGLRPSKKIKLMNAALECTLNKYEIYEGTKKTRKTS